MNAQEIVDKLEELEKSAKESLNFSKNLSPDGFCPPISPYVTPKKLSPETKQISERLFGR